MTKKLRLSILVFAIICSTAHSIDASDTGITHKLTQEVNLKISEQINALLEATTIYVVKNIELKLQKRLK